MLNKRVDKICISYLFRIINKTKKRVTFNKEPWFIRKFQWFILNSKENGSLFKLLLETTDQFQLWMNRLFIILTKIIKSTNNKSKFINSWWREKNLIIIDFISHSSHSYLIVNYLFLRFAMNSYWIDKRFIDTH